MIKRLFLGSTNVDFLKVGKLFYKVFLIEVVIFLAVLIMSSLGVLPVNLSVDFTGGTTYQLEANYSDEDISEVMNSSILDVSRYQTFDNSDSIIFRQQKILNRKRQNFFFIFQINLM